MWYLKKVASLCEQLGPVSTYLRPKFITFSHQNFGNGRKDKNGYRWTTFSFDNGKKFLIGFTNIELIFIFQT